MSEKKKKQPQVELKPQAEYIDYRIQMFDQLKIEYDQMVAGIFM
jgi:hypothetical protein